MLVNRFRRLAMSVNASGLSECPKQHSTLTLKATLCTTEQPLCQRPCRPLLLIHLALAMHGKVSSSMSPAFIM